MCVGEGGTGRANLRARRIEWQRKEKRAPVSALPLILRIRALYCCGCRHQEYEVEGVTYMRMKFYVKGSRRTGTVHLDMKKVPTFHT